MEKKQSPLLTDDEVYSIYRNELYSIDDPRYFAHICTGGNPSKAVKKIRKIKEKEKELLSNYTFDE